MKSKTTEGWIGADDAIGRIKHAFAASLHVRLEEAANRTADPSVKAQILAIAERLGPMIADAMAPLIAELVLTKALLEAAKAARLDASAADGGYVN